MRVRAKQLIGQILVGESCDKAAGWNCGCYYWTPRCKLERAAAVLGFKSRYRYASEPADAPDLVITNFAGSICIYDGKQMDQAKFDRELARIDSVSESTKKKSWSVAGSHADYWRVPAETIVEVAKNLGFEARLVPVSATGHSPVNLMLASFNGPVIIANGRKMDREKFDRELAKLSAVAESATDYGFPKTGTWEVLPKTIRLYPNANALKVHAALKSMGITPIRPDPTKGTPRRIIELAYYSMGIPDDVVFDFARFARELARARSSSE